MSRSSRWARSSRCLRPTSISARRSSPCCARSPILVSGPRVVELAHLEREPAGEPDGALILLHGRGVDERDLYPLLEELDPERKLFGITPGAPITNVAPGGRHWYVIREVGHPDEETFVDSLGQL